MRTKNRLDINVGCGRAILNFFLGASLFVLIIGGIVLAILWLLLYG